MIRRDCSAVHNAGTRRFGESHVATPDKRFVSHIGCARQEGSHINRGSVADEDSVGIDQIHLPIRLQRPHDLRGIARGYPIKNRGGSGGLDKLSSFPRTNGKSLPVNDGTVGGSDRQCVAGGLHIHRTIHDRSPCRIGK